jgi:hypothetical protein
MTTFDSTIARTLLCAALFPLGACHNAMSGSSTDGPNNMGDSGLPMAPPCMDLPLKTSRAPILLWSCQRQAFLTKLHDNNDPQWQELVEIANRTDTSNAQYADIGSYAALVYQITGDETYLTKAKNAITKQLDGSVTFDANYHRELSEEYAITYDWIQGGLTTDERKHITDILYGWLDAILMRTPPVRTGDTDQTVGSYFGAQLLALAAPEDPRSQSDVIANPFWGGLDATDASYSTPRNAIKLYMTDFAKGGTWMESSFYDPETMQLAAMGVEAMRNATGTEHFPEFADFSAAVLPSMMSQVTGDFQAMAEWGDIDEPRNVFLSVRYQTLGMYTGLQPFGLPMKALGVQYTKDIKAEAMKEGERVGRARFYYYFDPTDAAADYRAMLPTSYYATGQGMVYARQGWAPTDSFVFMHLRRPTMGTDHENAQFGNFQMYRKGAPVLTNPLGYGGGATTPQAVNSLVLAGLDSMPGRKVLGYTGSTDGTFTYFAGNAQGPRSTGSNAPAEFVHEWTRSFLYLSSTNHTADTLVVYDRVNADHPTDLTKYSSDDKTAIMAATDNHVSIVHALTSPTIAGSDATWTAGSEQVELSILAPASMKTSVTDEKTITDWPSNFPGAAERHFYIAIAPQTDQSYDTFLNVLQVSDSLVSQKPLRIASADGGMEGALISRPGQNDAVVLFSATQATRIRGSAFTFSVTPGSGGFDVYVADLDTSKGWTSSVGGDLTVDMGGLSRVSVGSGGAQTITISPK